MKKLIYDKNIESLYVHIPFCEHICFYCDFVKIKKNEKVQVVEYLLKLTEELKTYNKKLNNLKTIYIGGGTPSSLTINETTQFLEILKPYTKNVIEYSIELNPESTTSEKLKLYKQYGINRLSIGVQTFSDDLLKKIGRKHNSNKAIESIKLVRELGFNNISIDLMFNLFDQTTDDIYLDLEYIKTLKPNHISWYSLIMKEDSIWGKKKLKLADNDELFDSVIQEKLHNIGYERYEISNYCLDNKKSLHNLAYWTNKLFVGIGVGASGFEIFEGKIALTKNKGTYLEYKKEYEYLSDDDYIFQIIMMGLRTTKGIDLLDGDNQLIYPKFKQIIENNIKKQLLIIKNNHLFCSTKGMDLLNEILIDFL